MKRAITQKVKPVPSCEMESTNLKEGQTRSALLNADRRARTSAAMIGLAISMGASSLMFQRGEDRAVAAEPMKPEPALAATPSSFEVAALPPNARVEAATIAFSPTTSTPRLIRHTVQEGQTLWQLAQIYQVDANTIASSNGLAAGSVLQVGQRLQIPSKTSGNVADVPASAVETVSQSSGVEAAELIRSDRDREPDLAHASAAPLSSDSTDRLLKTKQEIALNHLQEKRDSLRDSLKQLHVSDEASLEPLDTLSKSSDDFEIAKRSPGAGEVIAGESDVSESVLREIEFSAPEADRPDAEQVVLDEVKLLVPDEVASIPTPEVSPSPAAKISIPSKVEKPLPDVASVPSPKISPSPAAKIASPSQTRVELPEVVVPAAPVAVPPMDEVAAKAATPGLPRELNPLSQTNSMKGSASIAALPLPSPVAHESEGAAELALVPSLPEPDAALSVPVAKPSAPASYKVRSGDTLSTIAQKHGVPVSELVKANRIRNPNLIFANQTLRIPRANVERPATSAISAPALTASSSPPSLPLIASPAAAISEPAPKEETALPEFPGATTFSQPQERLDYSNYAASLRQKLSGASARQNADLSVLNPVPDGTVSPYNAVQKPPMAPSGSQIDYVGNLRDEVRRMQAQYQTQDVSQPPGLAASLNSSASVTAIPQESTASPGLLSALPSNQINPEFNPERYTEALQREDRRSPLQAGESQPETLVAPVEAKTTEVPQRLAAAPTPPEAYESLSQPSLLGQMVSPDLPPLAAANTYLPGDASFDGYMWPTKGVLTSGYGWRWGRMHKGIDIAAPIGTPILAAAPGVVVTSGWNSGGYGNLVVIQHPDGSRTLYAHNNRLLVRKGQQVDQGQQIAEMGSTGYSTGPHCHFEVHPAGKGAMNPLAYLPGRSQG